MRFTNKIINCVFPLYVSPLMTIDLFILTIFSDHLLELDLYMYMIYTHNNIKPTTRPDLCEH